MSPSDGGRSGGGRPPGDARPAGDGGSAHVVAECRGLVKVYRSLSGEVHALKGVDVSIRRGTVTCVAGPSGSGKSTLLGLLSALDRPTAGSVTVLGTDTSGLSHRALRQLRRGRVALVRQRADHNLLPTLTVAQNLEHAARVAGAPRAEADRLLDTLGLTDRRPMHPAQLSGGEQQRLAAAMAVIGSPAMIVADEPTAELDHASAAVLLGVFGEAAAAGSAVLLSTHDPRAVQAASRVLRLRDGALSSDDADGEGAWAVIDAVGRIQLPPEALAWFPAGRARLDVGDRRITITPPEADGGAP